MFSRSYLQVLLYRRVASRRLQFFVYHSTMTKIEGLNELIQNFSDKKVVSGIRVTNLTAPGENFGSIVLKVDATLRNEDGKEETLHAIAKCLPEDEYFRKLFNVEVTVKSEMAFYTEIVPLMQDFQREHGVDDVIDCFPKYYGGRINLSGVGDQVDDHAVLIMENLKIKGFQNIDRRVGFSFEDAKIILKDLATFHSVSLALKLQKPEVFNAKIKKYCADADEQPVGDVGTLFRDILSESEACRPYIERIEELTKHFILHPADSGPTPDELFATLIHVDMWVNNTMQRLEDGKVIENKFIDFQNYMYHSPVRDMMFFLWSSCQYSALEAHLEELIEHYYHHFTLNLQKLNVDTTPYSFKRFCEEMKTYTPSEVMHSMFFTTFIVFGQKSESSDGLINFNLSQDQICEEVKNRLKLMVKHYGQLGWLH